MKRYTIGSNRLIETNSWGCQVISGITNDWEKHSPSFVPIAHSCQPIRSLANSVYCLLRDRASCKRAHTSTPPDLQILPQGTSISRLDFSPIYCCIRHSSFVNGRA